jgi:hypothetical protein
MSIRFAEIDNTVMKRDVDFIRELLMKFAEDERLSGQRLVLYNTPADIGFPDRSAEEIAYHVKMLIDQGFLEGSYGSLPIPGVTMVTWDGHEFLDDIRDDTIWNKTKERIKGLPGIGLDLIWKIAEAELKAKLGLP